MFVILVWVNVRCMYSIGNVGFVFFCVINFKISIFKLNLWVNIFIGFWNWVEVWLYMGMEIVYWIMIKVIKLFKG